MVFNILPTIVEIGLIAVILLVNFNIWFAIIPFATAVIYITFTLLVTEWRMKFRREMNEMDSRANTKAIDSLLNYETVKYFGNEEYEARRYDDNLKVWEIVAVKNQTSLSALNIGQGSIIAIGTTAMIVLAGQGVVTKELTLGDLTMVIMYLTRMFIPMNFLDYTNLSIRIYSKTFCQIRSGCFDNILQAPHMSIKVPLDSIYLPRRKFPIHVPYPFPNNQ